MQIQVAFYNFNAGSEDIDRCRNSFDVKLCLELGYCYYLVEFCCNLYVGNFGYILRKALLVEGVRKLFSFYY